MLGLSVKLCYMAEGTLFFSFSFHPTSFSVIFFICFLSSSSSSSSNLSFYSLPFLLIFLHSLLFLMFTLFLFFVILHCSFLLILFRVPTRPGNLLKKLGKIMEISWNFVSPKKWEPCLLCMDIQ